MRRSCLLVHDSINRPRLYPSYPPYPSLLRVNRTHTTQCFSDARHYTHTRKGQVTSTLKLKEGKIHELYREPRKTFLLVSYNLHFTTVFQLMQTNSQPSSLPPKSWRLKLKILQLELRMDLLNHQFVRKRFSR